jgi:hypothetical protein
MRRRFVMSRRVIAALVLLVATAGLGFAPR